MAALQPKRSFRDMASPSSALTCFMQSYCQREMRLIMLILLEHGPIGPEKPCQLRWLSVLVQLRKEFARVKRERQRVKDRLAELDDSAV